MDRRSSSMSTESRRRCSSLLDDSLGTTVHGVSNWYGTFVTPVTSTCCSAKQTYVSVCMQNRSLYATGTWFPKFIDFSELVLPSCTLFTALGIIEVNFHVQAIVDFHVPGIHFLHPARDYQIAHQSQFTFCACASLPFWWQGFQLAWSPLCLKEVLGQHARPEQHQIPNVHRAITVGEDGTLDGLRRSARSAVCTSASRFKLVTCPDCVLTL